MEGGFVKVPRALKGTWLIRDTVCMLIYLRIILEAQWREGHSIWFRGSRRDLRAGQCYLGLRVWAGQLGLNVSALRRGLKRLAKGQFVALEPAHEGTVVTVINWEAWHGTTAGTDTPSDTSTDTKATQKRHGNGTQQEVKNIRGGEGEQAIPHPPPSPSGTTTTAGDKEAVARVYREFLKAGGRPEAPPSRNETVVIEARLAEGILPERMIRAAHGKAKDCRKQDKWQYFTIPLVFKNRDEIDRWAGPEDQVRREQRPDPETCAHEWEWNRQIVPDDGSTVEVCKRCHSQRYVRQRGGA